MPHDEVPMDLRFSKCQWDPALRQTDLIKLEAPRLFDNTIEAEIFRYRQVHPLPVISSFKAGE